MQLRSLFLLAAIVLMTTVPGYAQQPVPIFDLHSDILLRVIDNGVDIGNPPDWPQVTIPTMRKGNVRDQVFAVWVNSKSLAGCEATNRALLMIDLFHDQASRHPNDIALARTVAEAEQIKRSGRIAVWLWIEGGAPINNNLALLRTFHRLGVRGMTLTWTNNIEWAGSSTDPDDPSRGLNEFGREVVHEMNRLRMIVDVSHVSERTFFDTIETSAQPIIASHSGCRALCDHPRDLTDKQLLALKKNGGIVGIVALPEYLKNEWQAGWDAAEKLAAGEIAALKEKFAGDTGRPEYREARRVILQRHMPTENKVTLGTYLDHVMHAVKVAGEDHVALGADFDGMWAFPEGFEKASQWQDVINGLRKRGVAEETIEKIAHKNAQRVFREVLGE